VEGNLHNKELGTMGKLQDNAKKASQILERAKRHIAKFESMGRYVSPEYKSRVYELSKFYSDNAKSGGRMSKRGLEKVKAAYDYSAVALRANKLGFTELKLPYQTHGEISFTPDQPVMSNITAKPRQMTAYANKMFKVSRPTTQLDTTLKTLILQYTGEMPKAGMSNEYFEVDDMYQPKTINLSQHIKIKKPLKYDELRDILSHANMVPEARQAYEDNAKRRSYISNVYGKDSLVVNDSIYGKSGELSDLSAHFINSLENLMNSSSAWYLAGAGKYKNKGYDSNQTKDNWSKLFKALDDLKDEDEDLDTFNELKNAIDNEDFDKASKIVEEVLGEALKEENGTKGD
jgi:hypothetical protein